MLLSAIILLSTLFPKVYACIGLGCLGVGCLPPPPCLFGPCLRTPIMMPCPCNAGYSCTPAGCLLAKARGAKTFEAEEGSETEVLDPSAHFLNCCNLLDVPESCNYLCSFEGYSKQEVQSAALFPTRCPLAALPQIHFCAARGADHTPCCKEAKVQETCEVFCDQRPGNYTQLSLSHLQCFDKFDDIKGCFLEFALRDYYETKIKVAERLSQAEEQEFL